MPYGTDDDSLFKKFWPADVHFIGRDITRFHAVIWPIILKAIGVEAPKQIHSTGFITLKGDRIAKSKSNGFSPVTLCDRYGADSLRYFMLKEGPIYNDIPYSNEVFLNTINSDLCNDLGNLVSRTLAMICQNFDAVIPAPGEILDEDKTLIEKCNTLYSECVSAMDEQRVDVALKKIFTVLRDANKYIDVTTPWVLAKTEEGKIRLKTVLYVLSEVIRICTVLLSAFLVEIPGKIFEQFNVKDDLRTFASIEKFGMKNFGAKVTKGDAIFKRIDIVKEMEFLDNPAKKEEVKVVKETKAEEKVEENKEITIDDFCKVELKVGTVVNSEKVEGSDKLLKNTVEIDGEPRIIVSGIAKFYEPRDIIGRQVVVVTNLKPIKLKGILSSGMILCAEDEKTKRVCLISPSEVMPNGSSVC